MRRLASRAFAFAVVPFALSAAAGAEPGTGLEVYHLRARRGLDRGCCVVGAVGASFTLDGGIDPGALAR